jgi:putative heme-binding domain-containing protein
MITRTSWKVFRSAVVGLPLLVCSARAISAQEPASQYTPFDVENGRNLYQGNCSFCHGPEGDGVPGVSFASGRFRRGSTDEQLLRTVLGGIPGTAMPPSNFSESQAGTIVAYLRSLAQSAAPSVPLGDAARGQVMVEGKGRCLTCHSIRGTGSRVGPNLTEIGAMRRAVELQRSLTDPNAEIRPDNRTVRIVMRDGATLSGRLLNQDTFSLQLLDQSERLLSVSKSAIREYRVLDESPMPSSRGTLNESELSDVLAYLVTLKGKPK